MWPKTTCPIKDYLTNGNAAKDCAADHHTARNTVAKNNATKNDGRSGRKVSASQGQGGQ